MTTSGGVAAAPVELPLSIENGIALVEASIGESGPLPMMVDTGAVDAITVEAAAAAGLEAEEGVAPARGRAGHDVAAALTHASELKLGAASLREASFLIIELPRYLADRGTRPPIAGILGQEFFTRFVVRLDYQKKRLTLSAPDGFRYAGAGVCVPFALRDRTPAVVASVDGVDALFAIDTGSNSGLVLAPGFVRNNGFDREGAGAIRLSSAAIDGLVDNVVTRLHRFDLAGATILRPLAQFRGGRDEIAQDGAISGSIGSKLLQQFVLTFDYARGELWLERSSAFGVKTSGGSTGFQAAKIDGPEFRVMTVIPRSPAAAAGLQVGDVITAIDGTPAAAVGLADLAELTGRPDGTVLRLRIRRGGGEQVVAVTLEELLP
jgi:hypothetical protein